MASCTKTHPFLKFSAHGLSRHEIGFIHPLEHGFYLDKDLFQIVRFLEGETLHIRGGFWKIRYKGESLSNPFNIRNITISDCNVARAFLSSVGSAAANASS